MRRRRRLERIRQLKELIGFSLEEVRRILEGQDAVAELRARFHETTDPAEQAAIVREAIEQTERLAALIADKQARLEEMQRHVEERLGRGQTILNLFILPFALAAILAAHYL